MIAGSKEEKDWQGMDIWEITGVHRILDFQLFKPNSCLKWDMTRSDSDSDSENEKLRFYVYAYEI